jgi:two-component system, NarL family, sensor histidine kinase UhpB
MSLFWRLFGLNAAIFVAATLALALSPLTISSPVHVTEAVVLVAGLTAILLVNFFLVRFSLVPLERLTSLMRHVDLLRPGQRLEASGPGEVRRLVDVFNEMLGRLERERRESGRRALEAQEAERKRVAQELHDEVGQAVTAVMLQLSQLARDAPPQLAAQLAEAQETTRASLDDVRRIARRLRPEALDDLGLSSALAALTTSFAEHTGLRVARRIGRDVPPLDAHAELVVYRVAQESLTNVARHAQAREAELRLERGPRGGAVLRVLDDGVGLNGVGAGSGIRGMRERALLVGAELTVEQRNGGGVEVRLELPERNGHPWV